MVKRGEIYYDLRYEYPTLGNVDDKLIIILNKIYLPTQDIIAVPVATAKTSRKYNHGCNQRVGIFYLEANKDFFTNNTCVQLFVLNSGKTITEEKFQEKLNSKTMISKGILKSETIIKLVKCITDLKDDIPEFLHPFLF
ncbi:MAG: hypothetical protein C0417_02160 [Chlorobiaceae bacterium]|nr:hypothetical protein [Chlorobiaceae bacterium]